jgi:hypothetical protein
VEPGYVKIIHPLTLAVAEVPPESLPHHYRAGWRLLSDDEKAAHDAPDPEPKPMTRAQAAKAARNAGSEE